MASDGRERVSLILDVFHLLQTNDWKVSVSIGSYYEVKGNVRTVNLTKYLECKYLLPLLSRACQTSQPYAGERA